MTDGPTPALHLLADLRVDIDGVHAQVTGDGAKLVVHSSHPLRLARAALRGLPAGPVGPRALADVAGQLLAEQGLSIEVTGPRGPLATIGADADSALGAALTGSRRIAINAVSGRRALAAAAGLAGTVALLVGLRARR